MAEGAHASALCIWRLCEAGVVAIQKFMRQASRGGRLRGSVKLVRGYGKYTEAGWETV